MTFKELEEKLTIEQPLTGCLLKCGEKSNLSNVLGIFNDLNVWYVYDTDDRGNICILHEGNEVSSVEAFYKRVLNKEKRYLKKMGIIKN